MGRKWIFLAPLAILGVLLFTFIGGEIVMHLWNWLLPPLFGWREVTFWQALGLLVLCRILFGGFGRGFQSSHSSRRTPEERERLRRAPRERFGFARPPARARGNEPEPGRLDSTG